MTVWRKSSWSSSGACVEVARDGGVVHVRDSKDPSGLVLTFDGQRWRQFLDGVRDGEFDLR